LLLFFESDTSTEAAEQALRIGPAQTANSFGQSKSKIAQAGGFPFRMTPRAKRTKQPSYLERPKTERERHSEKWPVAAALEASGQ
jgi:hypothetical protein